MLQILMINHYLVNWFKFVHDVFSLFFEFWKWPLGRIYIFLIWLPYWIDNPQICKLTPIVDTDGFIRIFWAEEKMGCLSNLIYSITLPKAIFEFNNWLFNHKC